MSRRHTYYWMTNLSVPYFHFSLWFSLSARWSWSGGMNPSRNWPPVTQMEESLFGSNMKVAGLWNWSMTVVHRWIPWWCLQTLMTFPILNAAVWKCDGPINQMWLVWTRPGSRAPVASGSTTKSCLCVIFHHVSDVHAVFVNVGEWLHLVPRWHSGSHLVPRRLRLGGVSQRPETLVVRD